MVLFKQRRSIKVEIIKGYIKAAFPHVFKSTETNPLIVAIIIYVVIIGVVVGAVVGILSIIPFVGVLFSFLGTVVGLY